MSDVLFTTEMRRATRKAHALSDALVNAKLIFALNSNRVWAEGLLIFYEIFKFLEFAMKEKKDENLGKLYVPELCRTSAFEADLSYYLGEDWKTNYKMRPSVEKYVEHLKNLFKTDSDLLMAYVYHLYMGLLSGGQILAKKRRLEFKTIRTDNSSLGEAVMDFPDKKTSELKSMLKERMNEIAEGLDESKKALLIEESIKVFQLNNSIIKTVKGTGRMMLQNIFLFFACLIFVIAVCYYYIRFFLQKDIF